jgi:hypothetical protein
MLAQNDRIAFSLNIVSAPAALAQFATAKAQVATLITTAQNLDTANANLLNPVNAKVTAYQAEFNYLDGNLRTTFSEQNIQDAANKVINNYFFPNNTNTVVPSISSLNNVWPKPNPYALTYAIGKNGTETYGTTTGETVLASQILSLITSAASHQDIENTSGENATEGNPTAMPPVADSIQSYAAVQTLKTNLVSAVNSYVTLLGQESAAIVTNDSNPTNQANNNAAKAAIQTILTAFNTWLAYPDFKVPPVSTYAAFYAYNSALLAPTKLHSTQLVALQTAINARSAAVAARISQLNTLLGTITQDISTGIATGTGLYGQRYSFLSLRLNSLGGSLTQLAALKGTTSAQDSVSANITSTASTYSSILPTTMLAGPANGTPVIAVLNSSAFAVGDSVYVFAEGQTELQRSIKTISRNSVTLNDTIPSKYGPASNARMYKDLT